MLQAQRDFLKDEIWMLSSYWRVFWKGDYLLLHW